MKYTVLQDFRSVRPVDAETLEQYRPVLPKEIISLWETYGFGTFLKGFMKVVNPNDYMDLITSGYFLGNQAIPVFATALGDVIVWVKNTYLTILHFRYGSFSIMEKGCRFFFSDLTDDEYVRDFLKKENYDIVCDLQGEAAYDECFGYFPLLCTGGTESPDRLKRVKTHEHIELIIQFGGGVV